MEELKAMPSTTVKHQKLFVHKDLRSCSHLLVRIDRIKKALEPPYVGPHVVVERFEKYFTVLVKNKNVNISIPDSMRICSKRDFFWILSCHDKLDATSLQRNSSKVTRHNRKTHLQNKFAVVDTAHLHTTISKQVCCEVATEHLHTTTWAQLYISGFDSLPQF
ncbi:hypothetical protein AVEN_86728-1 [Araneus ventricosus]|uniref:Uncharacterized protein n=1 Tax=Araneus ventricosus TaxID=182803 RepID=A0A4Y2HIC9_ARAVE|nr:hypothetical protein AVEN_86728-1 [Araneus ventricosus]